VRSSHGEPGRRWVGELSVRPPTPAASTGDGGIQPRAVNAVNKDPDDFRFAAVDDNGVPPFLNVWEVH
jgi:hypothetical protein